MGGLSRKRTDVIIDIYLAVYSYHQLETSRTDRLSYWPQKIDHDFVFTCLVTGVCVLHLLDDLHFGRGVG